MLEESREPFVDDILANIITQSSQLAVELRSVANVAEDIQVGSTPRKTIDQLLMEYGAVLLKLKHVTGHLEKQFAVEYQPWLCHQMFGAKTDDK